MSSVSSATTAALTTAATSTATAVASAKTGHLKIVGVLLAITSGLLIGSSFVFKKKGLMASQTAAGEGVGYLKSWLWWTGMTMMIFGELCNFAAYAFVDAVVVTPLGALSVVICAILSSIFLKEKLTFFGWVGCFLCIVGSVIIALNGPQEQAVSTISAFQKLFFAPGFLVYAGVLIAGSLVIIFFFAPKYGKKNMIWYIAVCSMIGGISVSCIQGLGAAIVTSIGGSNQFKQWFTYFLGVFVTVTLLTEIYYLNVALALFNTAMVTPTYYVIFTACTLITSVVLYQGLKASITEILTVVMGFLVICAGIIILQMSKVDPEKFDKLDRRSTLLLKAARQNVDTEKGEMSEMEDPGIDALRGASGAIGSIIRARSAKRMSMNRGSQSRPRGMGTDSPVTERGNNRLSTQGLSDLPRHQLYDAPVRPSTETIATEATVGENDVSTPRRPTLQSTNSGGVASPRQQTIKFGREDTAHYYPGPGRAGQAVHEQRAGHSGYPPIPPGAQQPKYGQARTAPATQTSFGGSAASYSDPFNSPPSENSLTSASLANLGSRDNSFDSLGSDGDLYDTPADKGRPQGRRYPSSKDDDREEQQRLVDPKTRDSPRPGGIRLLPVVPKSSGDLL